MMEPFGVLLCLMLSDINPPSGWLPSCVALLLLLQKNSIHMFFHYFCIVYTIEIKKVEATTLNERCLRLRPQDIFVRDHLQANDVLVVSIGGNDVALAPTPCTIASIIGLVHCTPTWCLEQGFVFGSVPVRRYIFVVLLLLL
jgi:hypothetical protein